MTGNPSVSVIVPVYKVEQYIKICVDSILAQTFQDFEIILVDDASPDGSIALCQKLYGGNDKVKFVRHEKNLGLGPARNTGIKHAIGKYVYFVDSDDFILPFALEKFFNAAEKNNADVVHAAGRYEIHQDEPAPVRKENLKQIWDKYDREGFLPMNLIYRLECWRNGLIFSTAWLYFCRRDFLQKNHIEFLPIISEDEPFSFALLGLAQRYYVLHETLYAYRRRSGSIMKTKNAEQLAKSIQSIAIGALYVQNFLDRVPRFDHYDQWREMLMNKVFGRFVNSHTAPYYANLALNAETNAAVEQTLKKLFGNGAPFVKNFFNGYHMYRRQNELITQQAQMLYLQNQQIKGLFSTLVREQPALLEIVDAIKSADKRILLLGTPTHGNLGDHAIVAGELRVLKDYFPDREVIEIPYKYLTGELGELLYGLGFARYVRRDDLIFMHGGGNLGNLWVNEEQLRRTLIEKFPDNKIVIFPQSIHFTDDDAGRRELAISRQIYNAHDDLHLMTRDENSFGHAQKFFPRVNNYLMPDAATVLHGILDDVDVAREGVLFVLRGDKEKVRDDAKIQILQKYFAARNIPFEVTDTVIKETVTPDTRDEKIRAVLMKIRKSKLVVTDRFHGVIFSFITRTPVLAFKSFDTKISSGIKWFENFPSVFYAESSDWQSAKDFVDKYYFAAEEKPSAALNVKIDTDSPERFSRALYKIVAATGVYPVQLQPPPPRHFIGQG